MRERHLSSATTGGLIIWVGVLVLSTTLAFLIGNLSARDSDESSSPSPEAELNAPVNAGEPGTLDLPDLGFSVRFPSEWHGGDSTLAGSDIHYTSGSDWTIYAYTRQESDAAQPGETPTLLIRIVTAKSEAGRNALSAYYKVISELKTDAPTSSYDVIANATSQLTRSPSSEGAGLIVNAQSAEGKPYASQARYRLANDQLYVVAYVRSSSGQIAMDQPVVQEIMSSIKIEQ
jgi:hypothetical protein